MYPVLFEIGNFFVSSLWVLVSIGFLIWGIALIRLTQSQGLKMAFLVHSFFQMLFWGAISGRIIHLILNIGDVIAEPQRLILLRIVSIWDRGFNFWGIVLGMSIYLYIASKRAEENTGKWLDVLTLAFLASIPFGHIGAFLEGLSYGRETSLPWGITFDSFTVPYTVPIHPTQIYALIYSLLIFVAIRIIVGKNWLKHDGDATLIAALSYSVLRLIEEFFRGDEAIPLLGLNLAHWICMAVFLFTGVSLLFRYNKLNFLFKPKTP